MFRVLILEETKTRCGADCPFYEPSGIVRDMQDLPLQTHCRLTMQAIIPDCEYFNMRNLRQAQVTEDEVRAMFKAIGRQPKRVTRVTQIAIPQFYGREATWRPKGFANSDKSAFKHEDEWR